MRRAISLVLVCILATPAFADGVYFTESFGGTTIDDQLGERMTSAVRFRAAVGVRRGKWAVELWGGAHLASSERYADCAVCDGNQRVLYYDTSALGTVGVDVKYLQPLSRRTELYLRGSMSYAMMEGSGLDNYAGRGLGGGAGVQLKGKVRALGFLWWPLFFTGVGPKVTAAIYADAGFDFYRLHPGGKLDSKPTIGARELDRPGMTIDARLQTISVGFSVGSDF